MSSAPAADPNAAFNALVAAAKAEGSVVVDGPPNDAVRDAVTTGFQKKYGISVSATSARRRRSRGALRAERAAGKYLLDVLISGSDTPIVTFLPSGWLDRIEPALIEPDVINPKDWKDGHIWYADPQHTILRAICKTCRPSSRSTPSSCSRKRSRRGIRCSIPSGKANCWPRIRDLRQPANR